MKVSDVVEQAINNWLRPAGVYRDAFDILDVGIDNAVLSLVTRQRISNIPSDSLIEIDDELMEIWKATKDTPSAGKTTLDILTRGYMESGAAAHLAGAAIRVNPDYPRQTIINAVKKCIIMFAPWGAYRRKLITNIPYDETGFTSLADPLILDVMRVLHQYDVTSDNWNPLVKGKDYVVHTAFSPFKIEFRGGGTFGYATQIVAACDYDISTFTSALELNDIGVPTILQEHMAMAVAGYVLAGKALPEVVVEEIRRLLSATGAQVPPGTSFNVSSALIQGFKNEYVESERRRLRKLDPYRITYMGT